LFNRLQTAFRARIRRQAVVLMYHRVAEPLTDVWKLAVSPTHFEQHLRVLRQEATVVPLAELVAQLARGNLKRRCVAITFDDGYVDNYIVAKPLLDAYQLPATFFIASGHTDQAREFWSDELESILLLTPSLPPIFPAFLGPGEAFALGLAGVLTAVERRQHQAWDAFLAPPPTRRSALFLRLYKYLQPLSHVQQQLQLQQLRQWAGVERSSRPSYHAMTSQQVRGLAASGLHRLGVHTVSHPALAFHSAAFQQQELLDNRSFLEELSGSAASFVAYPYGIYNQDTLAIAAATGFQAGLTTEARTITQQSDPYRLGRFQVTDLPGAAFARQLLRWRRGR
jgi:peptidoglycan/xylan/chitin deacetylase (PgdA/CDA1 family)